MRRLVLDRRWFGPGASRWRCFAAIAVFITACFAVPSEAVFAQSLDEKIGIELQQPFDIALAGGFTDFEPPLVQASCDEPLDCGCEMATSCPPVSWISGPYFKSGVAFALGKDLLEGDRETGYAISGGVRQPFGPDLGGDRYFFDVGGSYLGAYGETTRNTTGRQTDIFGNVTTVGLVSTLDELRRGSAHIAIGRFWGAVYDDRTGDPQVRLATRLGGRAGSIRGRFVDVPLVAPPANTTTAVDHNDTDVFGGIFLSTEAILLQRQYAFGQCQWTLDGEFANDWVDFERFHSGSLTTASLTLGFMLSR